MAAALRACGLVLVRLGGRRPFAVSRADLVNGRNARIPTLVRSSGRVRFPPKSPNSRIDANVRFGAEAKIVDAGSKAIAGETVLADLRVDAQRRSFKAS